MGKRWAADRIALFISTRMWSLKHQLKKGSSGYAPEYQLVILNNIKPGLLSARYTVQRNLWIWFGIGIY